MDESTATWSAMQARRRDPRRELSSRELLELYLDRIERLDGPVNAVVTLDVERARVAADAADDAAARGDALGPLHGLPITIKDAIETEGIRSTGGARELTDHVPAADAPAVARLKAAGAIVFGKTNVPRWSGDLQTYNEHLRHHQQPVGRSTASTGRVVGRCGRRGRGRASPASRSAPTSAARCASRRTAAACSG